MAGAQQSEEQARVVRLRAVEATPESSPSLRSARSSPPPPTATSSAPTTPSSTSAAASHGCYWYLGVARPSIVEAPEQRGQEGMKPVQSRAGHYYLPPDPAEVSVFRVSGPKFLKLHKGTWHAGPLFKAGAVDFYSLELSDTNVVDHTTHHFKKQDGITFVVED